MKGMKELVSTMQSKIKSKSRKGYQVLVRTFSKLQGRRGSAAAGAERRASRSKGSANK